MAIELPKKRQKVRGSKKLRQSAKNKRSGKYVRAYNRCVKRSGRWRGKKVAPIPKG